MKQTPTPKKSAALKFVLTIGGLSFFADFTCEGARSVYGPFLALLSASATVVASSPVSVNWPATACASFRGAGRIAPALSGRLPFSVTPCNCWRGRRWCWREQLVHGRRADFLRRAPTICGILKNALTKFT